MFVQVLIMTRSYILLCQSLLVGIVIILRAKERVVIKSHISNIGTSSWINGLTKHWTLTLEVAVHFLLQSYSFIPFTKTTAWPYLSIYYYYNKDETSIMKPMVLIKERDKKPIWIFSLKNQLVERRYTFILFIGLKNKVQQKIWLMDLRPNFE